MLLIKETNDLEKITTSQKKKRSEPLADMLCHLSMVIYKKKKGGRDQDFSALDHSDIRGFNSVEYYQQVNDPPKVLSV